MVDEIPGDYIFQAAEGSKVEERFYTIDEVLSRMNGELAQYQSVMRKLLEPRQKPFSFEGINVAVVPLSAVIGAAKSSLPNHRLLETLL